MIKLKSIKKVYVDNKDVGNLKGFQVTYTESEQMITIFYEVNGKNRSLTCDLEAVSFES